MRAEKDIRITKPVAIVHPTTLVLLPLIVTPYMMGESQTVTGELWQLTATGGSGYYQWSIQNTHVASVSGNGLLKSREVGTTFVIVRDNMNEKIVATLSVEVAPVY